MRDMAREVPDEYFSPIEKGGKIEVIEYETKNYRGEKEPFTKSVQVYLPFGYDDKKKYDVLYLMHGGGGNEKDYFGGNVEGSVLKELFDNMIAKGDVPPLIVVAPSYNTPYCDNATENCKWFAEELKNDLLPFIEENYATYKEREHRAFGGFSMGAACTWWVFEFALDYFKYFMPISGDSWCKTGEKAGEGTGKYMKNAVLKANCTKDDFLIYSGTGDLDIAYPNMTPLIDEMILYDDIFKYGENLFYCIRAGGYHNIETIYRIVYNGLGKFFSSFKL